MNPVLEQILTAAFMALPWGFVVFVVLTLDWMRARARQRREAKLPPRLK